MQRLRMAGQLQPLLTSLFSLVWKQRLKDWHTGRQSQVIKVRSWRSALIETPSGCRQSVTWCFRLPFLWD